MTTTTRSAIDPRSRVIVALDVPNHQEALAVADELDGIISFYKLGLELLMAGGMETILRRLVEKAQIFVDLKLPNDIPQTITRVASLAADMGVSFTTLSATAEPDTIQAAVRGRGDRPDPKLLFVSFLSSQDRNDYARNTGAESETFETFIKNRTERARGAGADGFIVSGEEIALLRSLHPDALLVSPGIRPAGSAQDDHKRSCTPSQAIERGSDYIVVGRPIVRASNRADAARKIVDEVEAAVARVSSP